MNRPSGSLPEHPGDEVLARGRFIRLLQRGGWEFIDHPGLRGIVVLVALTPDGKLLLVEQYRTALDARVIELPAGMAGDKPELAAEPLEEAARRELEEETGYRAGRIEFLGQGPGSPGRTRYLYSFFRARDLVRVHAGGGDETEDIVVHEVPLDEIDRWLDERAAAGSIVDFKIHAGLYFLLRERRT